MLSLPAPFPRLRPRGVTREMLYARTRELAVQAGRGPLQVRQADYEQARCELTGESEMDRQEAVLDASTAAAAGAVSRSLSTGGQAARD